MDQEYVSGEIRAELGRQNLSHANLASSLGWTEAKLSRRLSGKVSFRLTDINAIARTLGVQPTKFLHMPKSGPQEQMVELELGLSTPRLAGLWRSCLPRSTGSPSRGLSSARLLIRR